MVHDHTAADVARYVAMSAARYAGRSGDDADDIAQRVLASVGAIVRDGNAEWALTVTAVRNAIASIAKHDRRSRRSPNLPVVSAHSGIAERQRITEQERIELRIDIDACLAREGKRVRELCKLLETMTLSEASAVMSVPRSTLRGWLASLRERMEARGIGIERRKR